MTVKVNEEKMITLETGDGERVDFYVLEETRISGMNYLLVTDAPEDAEEGDYDRLLYVNDIHNADLIYVGQEIAIPWV